MPKIITYKFSFQIGNKNFNAELSFCEGEELTQESFIYQIKIKKKSSEDSDALVADIVYRPNFTEVNGQNNQEIEDHANNHIRELYFTGINFNENFYELTYQSKKIRFANERPSLGLTILSGFVLNKLVISNSGIGLSQISIAVSAVIQWAFPIFVLTIVLISFYYSYKGIQRSTINNKKENVQIKLLKKELENLEELKLFYENLCQYYQETNNAVDKKRCKNAIIFLNQCKDNIKIGIEKSERNILNHALRKNIYKIYLVVNVPVLVNVGLSLFVLAGQLSSASMLIMIFSYAPYLVLVCAAAIALAKYYRSYKKKQAEKSIRIIIDSTNKGIVCELENSCLLSLPLPGKAHNNAIVLSTQSLEDERHEIDAYYQKKSNKRQKKHTKLSRYDFWPRVLVAVGNIVAQIISELILEFAVIALVFQLFITFSKSFFYKDADKGKTNKESMLEAINRYKLTARRDKESINQLKHQLRNDNTLDEKNESYLKKLLNEAIQVNIIGNNAGVKGTIMTGNNIKKSIKGAEQGSYFAIKNFAFSSTAKFSVIGSKQDRKEYLASLPKPACAYHP